MLKLSPMAMAANVTKTQPPSGGCVLKQNLVLSEVEIKKAAAFGRLCVETIASETKWELSNRQPPSGGCVLKQ